MVEILAIIMAFVLGCLIGAGTIIGVALHIERKEKNGSEEKN